MNDSDKQTFYYGANEGNADHAAPLRDRSHNDKSPNDQSPNYETRHEKRRETSHNSVRSSQKLGKAAVTNDVGNKNISQYPSMHQQPKPLEEATAHPAAVSSQESVSDLSVDAVIAEDSVVVARGLTKKFGTNIVVTAIDLDIRKGECYGLLGPNGAGKTSTLKMLLGLSPFDSGTLHVLGQKLPARAHHVRARIGVVPQQDNLDPDFTVAENLSVYASYFGLSGAETTVRVRELLQLVELEKRADDRIQKLSGGMLRRLSIARALVNGPEMLILDEPTTGLDPQVRHHVWGVLSALRSQGITLLLTSHYMEEAERLCDRVAIMDSGSIIALDSPAALVAEHVEGEVLEIRDTDSETQELLSDLNHVRIEWLGHTAYVYTDNVSRVTNQIQRLQKNQQQLRLKWFVRPSGLEDVFMRLTGRHLRD